MRSPDGIASRSARAAVRSRARSPRWSRRTDTCSPPMSTTGFSKVTSTTSSSACTTSRAIRCRPISSTSRTRAVCSNTSANGSARSPRWSSATKPGGFVVIEDPDWVVFDAPAAPGVVRRAAPQAARALHGQRPATTRTSAPAARAAQRRRARRRRCRRDRVHDAGFDAVDGVVRARAGALAAGAGRGRGRRTPTWRPRDWPKRAIRSCRLLSPLQMTAWGRKPR